MTAVALPFDEAAFRGLLREGSPAAAHRLAGLVHPLPEASRKALAPLVRQELERAPWRDGGRGPLAVGVLACCGPAATVARLLRALWVDPGTTPLLVDVLRARSPRWLPGLPSALCTVAARQGEVVLRPLVRALVREGLAPAPAEELYLLSLPTTMWRAAAGPALAQLREDPGLLDELLRCFLVEGSGRALAAADATFPGGWMTADDLEGRTATIRHALLTLSAEGVVDRDRLLDETAAALLRDWPDRDLPWFVDLHEALAPTVAETARLEAPLRRALAASAAVAVTLAQRRLTALLQAGRLDVPAAVEASTDALLRADVAPVKGQLTFLAAVAKAHPDQRAAVAQVVALAGEHPKPAIAERARALAAKLGGGQSARPSAEDVDGGAGPGAETPAAAVDHVVAPRPPAIPVPPPAPAPVEPVTSVEELLDLLTRLVEEADDPVEVERALEALPRFAAARPRREHPATRRGLLVRIGLLAEPEHDVRAAPLLTDAADPAGAEALVRRARALAGERLGDVRPWAHDLRLSLAELVLVWLDGRAPGPAPTTREIGWGRDRLTGIYRRRLQEDWTLRTVLAMRLHETAESVASGGRPVLCLPTGADGSLAPEALSSRLAALPAGAEPAPVDAGLAALRVPPAGRADVVLPERHRAAAVVGAHLDRLAHHVPRWRPVAGASPRESGGDLAPALAWADPDAPAGGPYDPVGAVLDRRDPLALLGYESEDGLYAARNEQAVALWPLLVPHDTDRLVAHGLGTFYRALASDRSGSAPLLDAVGRSPGAAGPVTCLGLALALSARSAPDRTRAVDALLDLASRGCLDGAVLGTEVARCLTVGVATGSRVAEALGEALAADPVLAHPLTDLAQVLLPHLPGRKDAHLFVAVAGRAARTAGRGLALPGPFEALRSGTTRSGLAAACRSVPAP